ncbi:MAG: molybdate ABC transporter substrate-binding protein [Anaerolineales bacterium]
MIKNFAILNFIFAVLVSACTSTGADRELVVFAASSLGDAFDEIASEFEELHPGVDVVINYAGSSDLAAQLIEGAQADVFASANEAQMQNLSDADLVDVEPAIFATNRLTIIVPTENPAAIYSPADLAKPGIRLVLAAPGVPVREYADQSLTLIGDAGFRAAVYANLVSEEQNVRQVAAKVALGEADAGIVYVSDVTGDIADLVLQIPIPDEHNVIASYPIALLHEISNAELAQAFVVFVLSERGQWILEKWGFGDRFFISQG